jgi:hypothetical protein
MGVVKLSFQNLFLNQNPTMFRNRPSGAKFALCPTAEAIRVMLLVFSCMHMWLEFSGKLSILF